MPGEEDALGEGGGGEVAGLEGGAAGHGHRQLGVAGVRGAHDGYTDMVVWFIDS